MMAGTCLEGGNRQRFPRGVDIVLLVKLTQRPEEKVTLKITSNFLILEIGKCNIREMTSPMFCRCFVVELCKKGDFAEKLGF